MRSVLVVDDNDDLAEALCEALSVEGFQVRVAHDGADAFAKLARGPLPDVIVLDLGMPHMTGWQFRELQMRHAALAHIPVVVLSSSTPLAIDAAGVLEKPCPIPVLTATLRAVIPPQRPDWPADTGSWAIVRNPAEERDLHHLVPEAKTA